MFGISLKKNLVIPFDQVHNVSVERNPIEYILFNIKRALTSIFNLELRSGVFRFDLEATPFIKKAPVEGQPETILTLDIDKISNKLNHTIHPVIFQIKQRRHCKTV